MELGRRHQGIRLRLSPFNLYMLPTRFGWLWLGVVALLQVVAIQLESNGTLLLSFLLLGLFLLTMPLTHFNLQGLELGCGRPPPGFADATLSYPLVLRGRGLGEGVQLRLNQAPLSEPRTLTPGEHSLSLPWVATRRGLQRPGTVRVQTTSPLGLFVCWSRWDPPVPQLVYPARRPGPVQQLEGPDSKIPPSNPADHQPESPPRPQMGRQNSGEWHDLAPHRSGDPPARMAWKLLAQGRGRHTKTFSTESQEVVLLAPDVTVPIERALEHLSERIWRLHREGAAFGLRLGERLLPPAKGMAHRDQCLKALAEASWPR